MGTRIKREECRMQIRDAICARSGAVPVGNALFGAPKWKTIPSCTSRRGILLNGTTIWSDLRIMTGSANLKGEGVRGGAPIPFFENGTIHPIPGAPRSHNSMLKERVVIFRQVQIHGMEKWSPALGRSFRLDSFEETKKSPGCRRLLPMAI